MKNRQQEKRLQKEFKPGSGFKYTWEGVKSNIVHISGFPTFLKLETLKSKLSVKSTSHNLAPACSLHYTHRYIKYPREYFIISGSWVMGHTHTVTVSLTFL